MSHLFPSLPENPRLKDVLARFPQTFGPVLQFTDLVLRGKSPLSIGERELIAAFVSSLNACRFCMDGHVVFARAHGIDPQLIAEIMDDLDSPCIDAKLRPILRYVAKLTRDPARMVHADAQAVYDAGWSEQALFDAVQVCALFNFMNRIVEGSGVQPLAPGDDDPSSPLPRMESYVDFGKALGVGWP